MVFQRQVVMPMVSVSIRWPRLKNCASSSA
jgi:hypothetical protein